MRISHLRACVSEAEGRVEYSLAGHPPILHYHSATRNISRLRMEQLPIAMFPATNYQSSGIGLLPWDLLVVVSDGFLEVTNSRGEEFGLERLEEFIVQNANEPLLRIIDRLREETDRFGSHDDDQTILLLRSVEIGCG